MNVAVIGASDKSDRYSYKAVKLLENKGHRVFPVHKRVKSIDGLFVYAAPKDIPEAIDTVTLYVAADISSAMAQEIMDLKPQRLIFNPGAENPVLADKAKAQGIKTVDDCTLIMLNAGRF